MNELADQLKIDPVQLRILNEPKIDEGQGIPFSSRHYARVLRARRGEVRLVEAQSRGRLDEARRPDARLGHGRVLRGSPRDFPPRPTCSCATTARPASPAARRTSAPAPTRSSRSLPRRRPACRSRKSKWCSAIRRFRAGPISGGSMATGSVVPAVFAAADNAIASLLTVATTTPGSPFENRKPDDLAFEDGRVFVKADGAGEGRAVRGLAPARQPPPGHGQRQMPKATFGNPKAEVLDALVRLSLRRSHLAAGDRPAARQPRGDGDRCRPHHQPAGRPQPDRRRGRDGNRHGAVRAHVLRPAERRADQQQPGRLHRGGERRRAADRRALPRFPDKEINELGARGIGEIGLAGIAAAITARSTTPPAFACANCR